MGRVKRLADLTLYKWRYTLGYSILAMLFLLAALLASVYAPGGLTPGEIDTIATTNQLADGNFRIINLPFHALQLASFLLIGVSVISVKMPAVIFSFIAAIAIFFLLKQWFRPNVVILSMLIMAVAGQFIFLSQNATPEVSYITFTALILLFTSLTIQKTRFRLLWKIGLVTSVALSLYTPYFLYINLALLMIGLIHPHTRYHLLRKSERGKWIIAGLLFLILVVPLVYLCATSWQMLTQVIGYQELTFDFYDNFRILVHSYFWMEPMVQSGQIVPIMDFSSLALIVLGLLALITQRHTARAYMIFAWMLVALPLLAVNPHLTVIMTIPLFILLAIGTETLLKEWYKLFPKNPYARAVGLLMMILLIGVIISSGIDRYVNGYRHMPEAVREFSADLSLVRRNLEQGPAKTLLVVDKQELSMYQVLARFGKYDLTIATSRDDKTIQNVLVTRAANAKIDKTNLVLQQIITNSRADEGDRLYLYKTREN